MRPSFASLTTMLRFARAFRLDRACAACTDGEGRGPLCAPHAHEVDMIAARALADLRAHLHETAETVYAEPVAAVIYVPCPRCEGHGDVPTGHHSVHNPTGLEECPRCHGEREVIDELAARDAVDGALTLWTDALRGDVSLDQAIPSEHAYEVLS